MSDEQINQDQEGPRRLRILVVDDTHLSGVVLAELVARLDATVVSSAEFTLDEPSCIAGFDLSLATLEEVPQKTSFPRTRQGKDYESVFRRPRGRQRR